jgi:hypothetical protein
MLFSGSGRRFSCLECSLATGHRMRHPVVPPRASLTASGPDKAIGHAFSVRNRALSTITVIAPIDYWNGRQQCARS